MFSPQAICDLLNPVRQLFLIAWLFPTITCTSVFLPYPVLLSSCPFGFYLCKNFHCMSDLPLCENYCTLRHCLAIVNILSNFVCNWYCYYYFMLCLTILLVHIFFVCIRIIINIVLCTILSDLSIAFRIPHHWNIISIVVLLDVACEPRELENRLYVILGLITRL